MDRGIWTLDGAVSYVTCILAEMHRVAGTQTLHTTHIGAGAASHWRCDV